MNGQGDELVVTLLFLGRHGHCQMGTPGHRRTSVIGHYYMTRHVCTLKHGYVRMAAHREMPKHMHVWAHPNNNTREHISKINGNE